MTQALLGLSLLVLSGGVWAALPIEHWQQSGGAQVYLVRSDNLPMLDVRIDIDAGARRDPLSQAGLSEATALMIDKGVEAWGGGQPVRDENDLAEAWSDLGARFEVQSDRDRMGFILRTLTQSEVLERAVALAAQQLAVPTFPQAIWERERQRLESSYREAQNRPATHAERIFSQAIYGAHPYGYEAEPQTWAGIDGVAMRDFYRRHARACDARVTLVGAIDRSRAEALVDRLLAGWRAHGCAPLPPLPEVKSLQQERRIDQPFAAAQAQVLVGQPGIARSDPDFLPLLVGNHIFGGGGFESRLMHEIREKRGLTYGVYSYFSPGRHAGAFTVSMQTRPDQASQATALIHQELGRFVQEGPSEQELQAAKDSLVNGFALRLDSNRKLLDNVASLAWNGLPLNYLDRWSGQVMAISREQVRLALQRVLKPEKMVTVVVGGAP